MARNLYGDETVRVFTPVGLRQDLVELWEDLCMMMCRYAHQADVEAVERWPLHLLYARHASLTRLLQGENQAVQPGG